MSYPLRARSAVALAAAALLTSLLPSATAASVTLPESAKAKAAALSVSPEVHVGGQAVRFVGAIGVAGRRAVHLQLHMGRPGDAWTDVPNSTSRTDAQGRFDFTFHAPSMFQIRYRVVGGGRATAPYLFSAAPQEVTLTTRAGDPAWPFETVRASRPFTVVADTVPTVRAAMGVPPVIAGRTVSLQERVGTGWRTIARSVTDADGQAEFSVLAPASGQRVLRARQERWTTGGNAIGWSASFPTYFSVGASAYPGRTTTPATPAARVAVISARGAVRPTASQRFGWGLSRWDFAWDRGQDLDSPPTRGTKPVGSWTETSDGTGRAAHFNGGLMLQSKLEHLGYGDLGTTTATMRGSARKTGRWEFRIGARIWEEDDRPYRFRLELVPAGAPVTTCSPESVLVAGATLGQPGLEIGVRSQSRRSVWSRSATGLLLTEVPANFGVEVARDHVTWFVDGRPTGTIRSPQAWLGKRLVPRLSLIGAQAEMNGSQIDSDWQRGWTLDRGRQVTSGPTLTKRAYAATC